MFLKRKFMKNLAFFENFRKVQESNRKMHKWVGDLLTVPRVRLPIMVEDQILGDYFIHHS